MRVSRLCRLFLFLAPLALIDSPVSHAQAPAAVDFQRDIKPIFAKHCYSCHGPDKQKSGLRLDLKKAARAGGDGGVVILPGKSAESRLYRVISGSDPDGTVMPPKGDRLTPAQVDFIKRWIDEGAPWPDEGQAEAKSKHWAFQPIRRPAVPSVKDQEWVRNPIDAFILARLEKEGIKPAPMADRFTLLRRLSLDLTGLPPTLQDIERYVSDQSTDAYEKMVDYYLASPHFGEQWARHWLDLARYADSDGYEKDLYRPHAWRWRDWVIDAYNHDLPFDRFTIKQIAGDLLPNAGMDDRLATGFHRNTLLNREGGVDIEEDRVKAVVDRVSTLGSTWLGLTVGCAECHSHKYDPISQREFYQLYAFFNSTDERDIVAPPARLLPRIEQARELFAQIQNQVVKEFHASEHWLPFETWRERAARQPAIWQLPDSYELPTFGANNGANLYPQEDGSFLVTGTVGGATHYIMMSNLRLDGITAIRVEALTDEMLPGHGPGWAPNGNFVLSELRVEAAPLKDVNNLKKYEIAFAVADYSQPTLEIGKAIDGDEKTGWAVDLPHLPIHGIDRAAVFVLKEPIKLGAPLRLKVSLVQNHGQSHTLGRVRVSYTNTDPKTAAAQTTPEPMRNLAAQPFDQLSADQKCRLIHYYLATFAPMAPLLRNYAESLAALLKAKGDIRGQVLVQRRTPRPTRATPKLPRLRALILRAGLSIPPTR
jgi:mono/diheme cytochrome c family protein